MQTKTRSDETGAALIAVLFISILLVTACAFLLYAVANNSRNSSDVLAETKAYYAAESGLQAATHVLRHSLRDINNAYSQAALSVDLRRGDFSDPSVDLTNVGLDYNVSTNKVDMAANAKYSIEVVNPDDVLPYTFQTSGAFTPITGTEVENLGRTLCVPTCGAADNTKITFHNRTSTAAVVFPLAENPVLGHLSVLHSGLGAAVPANVELNIHFQMASPRSVSRTIKAVTVATSALADIGIDFATSSIVPTYALQRTKIQVQNTSTPCDPATNCANRMDAMPVSVADGQKAVYINVAPIDPFRLIVRSTGYGPGGSKKMLEGVIQKNFFDDLSSTSAISMIGPAAGMVFDAGTGGPRYCGVDGGYEPGGPPPPNTPPCTLDPGVPIGPSIGVTDPAGLPTVVAGGGGATLIPPPGVVADLPEWQQSPANMDALIQQMRNTAINSGTYIANGGSVGTPGSHSTGTGITFCDGNCSVGPVSGGGILVVTGSFEYHGNFSFNGMIIVTGAGGMHRNGGGGGQIIGNVIIAPYNPADLNAGFLPPSFTTNGGGNSDILFGGTSVAFDGTTAVTNLMIGIAEK